MQTSDNTNT